MKGYSESGFLCAMLTGGELPQPPGSEAGWESLLTLAYEQGVAPLLAWRLQAVAGKGLEIPMAAQERLPAIVRKAAANSLQIDRTVARLGARLAEARIRAIFLKGVYFRTLYPNPALRTLDDIDLLAKRGELEAARRAIEGLGYRWMRPLRQQDDLWMATDHHYVFHPAAEKDSPAIELHWNLGGNDGEWRTPALDWFWEEARPLESGNTSLLTLSPTAHLLHQAAHQFLQHPERIRLKWLYDLHLLITDKGEALDWELAIRKAADFRWSHALALALSACADLFGTALPEGVVGALAKDFDARSIALVALANRKDSTAVERAAGFLGGLPPEARWKHLAGILFPSRKYMLRRYQPTPEWTFIFYYPYRWLNMAAELVVTAARRIGEVLKK